MQSHLPVEHGVSGDFIWYIVARPGKFTFLQDQYTDTVGSCLVGLGTNDWAGDQANLAVPALFGKRPSALKYHLPLTGSA